MFHNEDSSAKTHFDDCYFYFYSTCKKGNTCPYRHCEAALGTEVVCSLWQVGKCFRLTCPLRHMECQKERSTTACYWETQPTGCRKPHCVFMHSKPREGIDNPVVSKEKLILPVVETENADDRWIPASSNRIVMHSSGQEQRNWMPVAEEEENSLSLPPAVEPLVVCFDEESDSESCTSTSVKVPAQERRVHLLASDAVDKLHITSSVRKQSSKKGKIRKSNIELGIKTLQEIREEKMQGQLKQGNGSSEDEENLLQTNTGNATAVLNCNADEKLNDLRARIQQRRTINKNSTDPDKNLNFKIKTLEEIRKEKAHSFADLTEMSSAQKKKEVNIPNEIKENKAVDTLKHRRVNVSKKDKTRKVSSTESSKTSTLEVIPNKNQPKKLKRQSIEIYRPPKS